MAETENIFKNEGNMMASSTSTSDSVSSQSVSVLNFCTEVEHITPNPDSLIITHHKKRGSYSCQEDGCSYKTSSPSVLGLHKAQAHNITTGPKKGVVRHYFCPSPGCYFNPQTGRFFKNLDMLRTHYMKAHMEKKFQCSKCEKGYGLERDCLRHEQECGQVFSCPDCGKAYNNKNSLKMHCVSNRHKQPPEICPKPKMPTPKPVRVPEKPKLQKVYPVPILPKPPSVTLLLPPTVVRNTENSSVPSDSSIKVLVPISNAPDFNTTSSNAALPQRVLCDNVTQTVKSLLTSSSLIKVKCHAPTQTRLSILEKAMKSCKIPVNKTSKGTQKSYSKSGSHRKRKESIGCGTSPSCKRLTIATLTDPKISPLVHSNNFTHQSIESQTTFSKIYDKQITQLPFYSTETQNRISAATQTRRKQHLHGIFSLKDGHSVVSDSVSSSSTNSQNVALQCNVGSFPNIVIDSNTQTFGSFVQAPPFTKISSSDSETQTNLIPASFSSKTQTSESSALDSGTQTLLLDPHLDRGRDFLDELLSGSEMNDMDTQTLGSFLSDMMTQTLDQISPPEMNRTTSNSGNMSESNIMYDTSTSETTTQTLEEMVDNITQTLNSDIVDCMTQTNFRNDTMTQTAENLGVDSMTQTFNISCGTLNTGQPSFSLEHFADNSSYQSGNAAVQCSDSVAQTTFESNRSLQIQTLVEGCSTNINNDNFTQNIISMQPSCTLPVDTVTCQVPGSLSLTLNTSTQTIMHSPSCGDLDVASSALDSGFFANSMTQTLSLPNEDITLETLLSDMATQTFESGELSFDAFLHSPDDLSSSNHVKDATLSPILTDSASQTLVPFGPEIQSINDSDSEMSAALLTPNLSLTCGDKHSMVFTFDEESRAKNGHKTQGDDIWENGFQTRVVANGEIGTQTMENSNIGNIGIQTEEDTFWENGTQTGADKFWGIGTQTQTGAENIGHIGVQTEEDTLLENGTQTGADHFGDIGIQTGADNFWGIGTQTQTGADNTGHIGVQTEEDTFWENGTQTGADHFGDIGIQTGADNFWGIVGTQTQTGADNIGHIGVQTEEDTFWENATQTGADHFGDIGNQTGADNFWGIGTQTGADNTGHIGVQTEEDTFWENGTRTRGDHFGHIGIQTGADNFWGIGTQTQTGADNIGHIGVQTEEDTFWENATQTGADNFGDIGIQTGADNFWGIGTQTQTGGDNIANIGIQTGADDVWESGTRTRGDHFGDIGIQTGTNDFWENGTQTGGDNFGEIGIQTGMDDVWDSGTQTQTGGDNFGEIGIQTGTNNFWENGTQTGGDNFGEIGIQTGVNSFWENGTQTGGDNFGEIGIQVETNNFWENGTQTGGDNIWDMGTQTAVDNAFWEMGTQTGGVSIWDTGTQTRARGNDFWEMGTQTGGVNIWEMGTQTGGVNIWEMGTQTMEMENLLTDMTTQTGDDLIDFLLEDE